MCQRDSFSQSLHLKKHEKTMFQMHIDKKAQDRPNFQSQKLNLHPSASKNCPKWHSVSPTLLDIVSATDYEASIWHMLVDVELMLGTHRTILCHACTDFHSQNRYFCGALRVEQSSDSCVPFVGMWAECFLTFHGMHTQSAFCGLMLSLTTSPTITDGICREISGHRRSFNSGKFLGSSGTSFNEFWK